MAEISDQQVSAAFAVGRRWLAGELTRSEGVNLLKGGHGINPVSANDLLQVMKAMIAGDRFTRSISAAAAGIFLQGIEDHYGAGALQNAIEAIDQHIIYYEGLRSVTLRKMRGVTDSWKAKLPAPSFDEAAFADEVAAMLGATKAERESQLPAPGAKPKAAYSTVKVFQRSAAVVAQALLRADGKCETCGNPAPFIRAADGRPYLEVHHVVRLADGGDDTVANAIAVCPNCHRFHHFG